MRSFVTALAASALIATAAGPAAARGRHHRHHDDIDAGDVVAGAVAVAGIAALASAIGDDRREEDAAVEHCSAEAEGRTGGRVAEILHVGKRKGYYTVEGALESGGDGPGNSFTCTTRHGAIYDFQAGGEKG
jgi:hypothetical protein